MGNDSNTTRTTTPTPSADTPLKNVLDISDDAIIHDPLYENPIAFIKNVVGARATPNVFRTRNKFYGRFITQLYKNGTAGKEGDGMWDRVLATIKQSSAETVQETDIFVAVVHVEELQSFSFPEENDFELIEKIARNGGIFKSYVYTLHGGETPKYGDLCLVSFNDPETRTEGIFEHPLSKGAQSAGGPSGGSGRSGGGGSGGGSGGGRRGGSRRRSGRRSYRDCPDRTTSEQAAPPTPQRPPRNVVAGLISDAGSLIESAKAALAAATAPSEAETAAETPAPKTAAERRRERRIANLATCRSKQPLSALGQSYGIIDVRHERTKPNRRRRPYGVINKIVLHQTACRMGENPLRYKNLEVHFAVTRGGKIIWCQDIPERSWHAQSFNGTSVGIEFDGWFAGIHGDIRTFWKPSDPSPARRIPMGRSSAQVAAGRKLIDFIHKEVIRNGGKIKGIHAHRQAYAPKTSCPGEIVWKTIGVWAQNTYGYTDGGEGYRGPNGNGNPIPRSWDPKRSAPYSFRDKNEPVLGGA